MKRKNLIPLLSLLLVMGAGFLWAIEKPISTDKKRPELMEDTSVSTDLLDAEGQGVNLEDFQGKIVFINNWASWCPPCVAEMPTIEKLKGALPDEEVAFVMISYDQDPNKGLDWMKNKGMDLPVYFPGENLPKEFVTNAIPSTFVLDREGEILFNITGMADYSDEKFIAQMKAWLKGENEAGK